MKNYTLSDILRFNPFDNKDTIIQGNSYTRNKAIRYFFDEIFVDFDKEIEETKKKFTNYLSPSSNSEKNFIFLYGPGGSGKTTFLSYMRFEDKDLKDKYIFMNINLIQNSSVAEDKRSLKDLLQDELREIFSNKESIDNFLFKCCSKNKSIFSKERSKEDEIRGFFYKVELGTEDIDSLFKKLNIEDLLVLYIIDHLLKNIASKRPFIFIFDNLDELSQIYIARELVNFIQDIYTRLQEFCIDVLNINFRKYIRFILVFREVNYSLLSIQQNDRLYVMSEEIPFKQDLFGKIISQRIEAYQKQNNLEYHDEHAKNILELSDIIINEEKHIATTIIPLFNYDKRMLVNTIITVTDPLISKDPDINNIRSQYYMKIARNSKFGARGIIFSYILKYLCAKKNSPFREIIEEERDEKKCNLTRMGLTALCTLSGVSGTDDVFGFINDEETLYEATKQVSLKDLYDKLDRLYDFKTNVEDVKKIIKQIFRISNQSYELFAIVHNLQLNETNLRLDSKIENLLHNEVFTLIEKEKFKELDNIKVRINSSSIIYAQRIFIHFEYFNLLSNIADMRAIQNEDIFATKPLFQRINFIENNFEFEKCIHQVFDQTEKIIKAADHFFCERQCKQDRKNCGKNCMYAIQAFKQNGFCFNNVLFSSRVISSHINYLDEFRKHLWKSKCYGEQLTKSLNEKVKCKAQKILIEMIERYIKLYEREYVFDSSINIKKKMDEIKRNMVNAYRANERGEWENIMPNAI